MKRYGGSVILLFIILLGILIISVKAPIFQSIDNFKIDRTDPEKLIEQFYNGEKNLDQSVLKQFFYGSMSDTSMIKLKIKCFDINRIKLDRVMKIDRKDTLVVISCSFSTFFNGIDLPRRDMEVVKLVKKADGFYIISNLEDISELTKENIQWLQTTESLQRKNMWNSSAAAEILDSQADFDNNNRERMQQGSIKLKEIIKKQVGVSK